MVGAGDGVLKAYSKMEKGTRPYVDSALVSGKRLWEEGGAKVRPGVYIHIWVALTILVLRFGKERGGWRESMETH